MEISWRFGDGFFAVSGTGSKSGYRETWCSGCRFSEGEEVAAVLGVRNVVMTFEREVVL